MYFSLTMRIQSFLITEMSCTLYAVKLAQSVEIGPNQFQSEDGSLNEITQEDHHLFQTQYLQLSLNRLGFDQHL